MLVKDKRPTPRSLSDVSMAVLRGMISMLNVSELYNQWDFAYHVQTRSYAAKSKPLSSSLEKGVKPSGRNSSEGLMG